MNSIRARGEQIREFLLQNVEAHSNDIASFAAAEFSITRQAINKHLARLVKEEVLEKRGRTKNLTYHLRPTMRWEKTYDLSDTLAEDVVLRNDVAPVIGTMPNNVAGIWYYGFTEMFNNAIDHSDGKRIHILIEKTATTTKVMIQDDGIGIFTKIQQSLGLLDERHAVLELSKGKLTTDPANHTGEGIFFSSRMFDDFAIISGGTFFSHTWGEQEDWILEREKPNPGTAVHMTLNNHTSRTTQGIFSEYTSGDFGFTKTVVPVKLAKYGNENLVSRSQAKRMMARVDRFKTVILDFSDIETVGQAFTDEIFRVFPNRHPEIELLAIHASRSVQEMIHRATNNEVE